MGDYTYQTLTPFEIMLHYKQPGVYGSTVNVDATSYMSGVGQYVTPANFSGVRDLASNQAILTSGQSYISRSELLSTYHMQQDDFFTSVNFRYIDASSANFFNNSFVYGIAGFKIDFDGISIQNNIVSLVNYRIVPQSDNFDNTTNDLNAFTRLAFEAMYGSGTTVDINYTHPEAIPLIATYDTSQADNDWQRYLNLRWDQNENERVTHTHFRPGCAAQRRRDVRWAARNG